MCIQTIQSGEDPQDAVSCRSFFATDSLIIGLFRWKWPIKVRHPMGLHHSVYITRTLRVFDSNICMWLEYSYLTRISICDSNVSYEPDMFRINTYIWLESFVWTRYIWLDCLTWIFIFDSNIYTWLEYLYLTRVFIFDSNICMSVEYLLLIRIFIFDPNVYV